MDYLLLPKVNNNSLRNSYSLLKSYKVQEGTYEIEEEHIESLRLIKSIRELKKYNFILDLSFINTELNAKHVRILSKGSIKSAKVNIKKCKLTTGAWFQVGELMCNVNKLKIEKVNIENIKEFQSFTYALDSINQYLLYYSDPEIVMEPVYKPSLIECTKSTVLKVLSKKQASIFERNLSILKYLYLTNDLKELLISGEKLLVVNYDPFKYEYVDEYLNFVNFQESSRMRYQGNGVISLDIFLYSNY